MINKCYSLRKNAFSTDVFYLINPDKKSIYEINRASNSILHYSFKKGELRNNKQKTLHELFHELNFDHSIDPSNLHLLFLYAKPAEQPEKQHEQLLENIISKLKEN